MRNAKLPACFFTWHMGCPLDAEKPGVACFSRSNLKVTQTKAATAHGHAAASTTAQE
jgi:hypothetical protein